MIATRVFFFDVEALASVVLFMFEMLEPKFALTAPDDVDRQT